TQRGYMGEPGNGPLGPLGDDGPPAALPPRPNLPDLLNETVGVATNPAIDREREIDHFSTRVLLGPRPSPGGRGGSPPRLWIELATPILIGGHSPDTGISSDDFRALARERGTWLLAEVIARFTAAGRRAPAGPGADPH